MGQKEWEPHVQKLWIFSWNSVFWIFFIFVNVFIVVLFIIIQSFSYSARIVHNGSNIAGRLPFYSFYCSIFTFIFISYYVITWTICEKKKHASRSVVVSPSEFIYIWVENGRVRVWELFHIAAQAQRSQSFIINRCRLGYALCCPSLNIAHRMHTTNPYRGVYWGDWFDRLICVAWSLSRREHISHRSWYMDEQSGFDSLKR